MLFNGREETEPKRLDVDWWDLRVNLLDLQTMGSCPSKATHEGHVEHHVALEALASELKAAVASKEPGSATSHDSAIHEILAAHVERKSEAAAQFKTAFDSLAAGAPARASVPEVERHGPVADASSTGGHTLITDDSHPSGFSWVSSSTVDAEIGAARRAYEPATDYHGHPAPVHAKVVPSADQVRCSEAAAWNVKYP